MSFEWLHVTLSDIAEINPRRPIAKATNAPFIDMAAISTHARDVERLVPFKEYKGGGSKFWNGDTLVARITPCLENGKTALVRCLPANTIGHGSTEFIVLGPRKESDSSFVYYLARSPAFRNYAISRMEGTSGRQRVPNSAVANYSFFCPPPEERANIGNLLSSLDDRITLLRETNKTLESIAQAIFKSWFVDFDPVRAKMEGRQPESMDEDTAALFPDSFEESELGLIPRGWDVGQLSALLKLHKGSVNPGATPSTEYLHYSLPAYDADMMAKKEFGATIKSNKTTVPENAVLFSKLNPVIPRVWLPIEFGPHAICSTEFLPFAPTNKSNTPYIYCLLKSPGLRDQVVPLASGTSNSHQRIRPDSILSLVSVLPNTLVMEKFEAVVEPLLARTKANQLFVQLLSAIRDTLLPRLISGQLRLPEAQEQIEAALP